MVELPYIIGSNIKCTCCFGGSSLSHIIVWYCADFPFTVEILGTPTCKLACPGQVYLQRQCTSPAGHPSMLLTIHHPQGKWPFPRLGKICQCWITCMRFCSRCLTSCPATAGLCNQPPLFGDDLLDYDVICILITAHSAWASHINRVAPSGCCWNFQR